MCSTRTSCLFLQRVTCPEMIPPKTDRCTGLQVDYGASTNIVCALAEKSRSKYEFIETGSLHGVLANSWRLTFYVVMADKACHKRFP